MGLEEEERRRVPVIRRVQSRRMAHVSLGFAERKQESRGLKGDAKFHFRLGEEGGRDFMGVIEDRIR